MLSIKYCSENFIKNYFNLSNFIEYEYDSDSDISDSEDEENDKEKQKSEKEFNDLIIKLNKSINLKFIKKNDTEKTFIHKIVYYSFNEPISDISLVSRIIISNIFNIDNNDINNNCNDKLNYVKDLTYTTLLLYSVDNIFNGLSLNKNILTSTNTNNDNSAIIIYTKPKSNETCFKLIDISTNTDIVTNKYIPFGLIQL